jgi:hypothetical protein
MTVAKDRHLHAVPTTSHADVETLRQIAQACAERRTAFAYQQQHARAATQDPEIIKERDALVSKTASRLQRKNPDVRGLLTELADAMLVTGYMEAAGEQRPMSDAVLATVAHLEDIEKQAQNDERREA